MSADSILIRADYDNYLVYLYFGSETDLLNSCINRAYRDFNRTLHGFGNLKNSAETYHQAVESLKDSLDELKNISASQISTESFDDWHKTTCNQLTSLFTHQGHHLFIGQAQKWVNMTMKYIFTLGEDRISGFGAAYACCHVPLDNILLKQLGQFGFPLLNCAWSRLDRYDEYLEKQNWIRQKFSIAPMDVEFLLWLGKEIEPGNIRCNF